jgi:predicted anti-sigma-YlaC factor YlaD
MVSFDGTGFMIAGIVILSLGLGFLLSAAAAYGISKSAGLLEPAWKPSTGRA